MKPLPMPLRVAAGLVAETVERARQLPRHMVELPVTAVSQALQMSMRLQQKVTDLAIKGDRALDSLRPAEENPSWATFDDEEQPADQASQASSGNGSISTLRPTDDEPPPYEPAPYEPVDPELAALDIATPESADTDETGDTAAVAVGPAGVPGYDALSIAQLRARLRLLTVTQLEELLAWEVAHQDRPAFVTMLSNRITTVTSR